MRATSGFRDGESEPVKAPGGQRVDSSTRSTESARRESVMTRCNPGVCFHGSVFQLFPFFALLAAAGIGCLWKNSHIRSLAEMFLVDLPKT